MIANRGEYRNALYDRPSVTDCDGCAVCGRLHTQKHHVIEKGAGGVTSAIDRRIPLVRLCASCHSMVHDKRRLHLQWSDGRGGWLYWFSPNAMDDELAWALHAEKYRLMPGWIEQRRWGHVIGGKR